MQSSAGVIWSVSIASSFLPGIFGSQKIRALPRSRWSPGAGVPLGWMDGWLGRRAPGWRRAG